MPFDRSFETKQPSPLSSEEPFDTTRTVSESAEEAVVSSLGGPQVEDALPVKESSAENIDNVIQTRVCTLFFYSLMMYDKI